MADSTPKSSSGLRTSGFFSSCRTIRQTSLSSQFIQLYSRGLEGSYCMQKSGHPASTGRRATVRVRVAAACLPCKLSRTKCNDYRPCSRCRTSRPAQCVESSISTNGLSFDNEIKYKRGSAEVPQVPFDIYPSKRLDGHESASDLKQHKVSVHSPSHTFMELCP